MALENGANDRIKNEKNILDRLDRIEAMLASAARRDTSVSSLGDLSDNLGEVRAGRFIALSAGAEPTDADGCGVFMSADGEDFGDGQLYNIGGVNNGQLMFGLRATDGAGVFAGGEGVIDGEGINLNGPRYALRHFAYGLDGVSDPRFGAFEMYYPDESSIPSLRLSYSDATTGEELIANGDMEAGWSGWTATNDPGGSTTGTIVSAYPYEGAYNAQMDHTYTAAGTAKRYSYLTSALGTVEGGQAYAFTYALKGGGGITPPSYPPTCNYRATVTSQMLWYSGAGALLGTTTLYSGVSTAPYGYIYHSGNVYSPTAAASVAFRWRGDSWGSKTAFGTLGVGYYLDSVSLMAAASYSALQFTDQGPDFSGGLWPCGAKLFGDQLYSGPTMTEAYVSDQIYGVRFLTSAGANGDEYKFHVPLAAGTYTFTLLGRRGTSNGKADAYLDGILIASAFEWYAAATTANIESTATGTIATNGVHEVIYKINGKHASSSGYNLNITCLTATRTG